MLNTLFDAERMAFVRSAYRSMFHIPFVNTERPILFPFHTLDEMRCVVARGKPMAINRKYSLYHQSVATHQRSTINVYYFVCFVSKTFSHSLIEI